ncbi:hypothetical protein AVEN_156291-1 [Araneus ventricosus]|uniref:Uncharacterized protein n=1 Tax=Araneus ventricosus TaxID=182803 RepID=A0A4Y2UFE3_ARAVE|nr:hypothetical protein AVEN_156291-1 [Araneus ventricosus]
MFRGPYGNSPTRRALNSSSNPSGVMFGGLLRREETNQAKGAMNPPDEVPLFIDPLTFKHLQSLSTTFYDTTTRHIMSQKEKKHEIGSHYASEYYLHVVDNPRGRLQVVVASEGGDIPNYLKIHIIRVIPDHETTLHDWMNFKPSLCNFGASIKWRGTMRRTYQTVNSREALETLLQNSSKVYCVWGEKQANFFKTFLDNVIDISSDFIQLALKKEPHFEDSNNLRIPTT